MAFVLGNVVRDFGFVALVVGHDAAGAPILRTMRHDGRVKGGKWTADPAKCVLLTDAELTEWYGGVHLGQPK